MGWWNGAPEPEAPRYIDLDSVATPNFKKIKDITHDDFQKLQKITNALTGHEYVKTKNGEYVYRKTDETPEQKKEREAILNTYNTTMREFGDRVRNFLKETGSLSSGLRSQIQAIQNFGGAFNIDNLKNSGMQEVASSIVEFSSNMDQIRNYIEGRVNDYYDQAQRALDDKLGAEGKDSSIGMWQQAQLDNDRRKAMMDADFYMLTEGKGKLLDNERKAIENQSARIDNLYKPILYDNNLINNYQGRILNERGQQVNEMSALGQLGINSTGVENTWIQQDYTNRATAAQMDNENELAQYKIRIGNAMDHNAREEARYAREYQNYVNNPGMKRTLGNFVSRGIGKAVGGLVGGLPGAIVGGAVDFFRRR